MLLQCTNYYINPVLSSEHEKTNSKEKLCPIKGHLDIQTLAHMYGPFICSLDPPYVSTRLHYSRQSIWYSKHTGQTVKLSDRLGKKETQHSSHYTELHRYISQCLWAVVQQPHDVSWVGTTSILHTPPSTSLKSNKAGQADSILFLLISNVGNNGRKNQLQSSRCP
jgi:hypothetical protein